MLVYMLVSVVLYDIFILGLFTEGNWHNTGEDKQQYISYRIF